jgi:hypothetical protein
MANYYVSITGNDSNSGSESKQWKTIQHAADTVKAGDTVTIFPGVYSGFYLLNKRGSADAYITFRALPGVIINNRSTKYPDAINLEKVSYVVVEGFIIENKDSKITRGGIRVVGTRRMPNAHVIIRNNNVNAAQEWNIFSGFTNDIVIENNISSGAKSQHGIYVSNSGDRPLIRTNTVFSNRNCGIHMNGDKSQGGDGLITGAIVEGNVLYNNGVGGGSAINADGVQGSMFRNNLIYNNHASGISLFRDDGAQGSKNNYIENNTVIMPAGSRWAINIQNGSTGAIINRNVIANRNTSRGGITISSDSLPGMRSDNNLFLTGKFCVGSKVLTISGWRSSVGQDLHSLTSTEKESFVDHSLDNYNLSSSAPLQDVGRLV